MVFWILAVAEAMFVEGRRRRRGEMVVEWPGRSLELRRDCRMTSYRLVLSKQEVYLN